MIRRPSTRDHRGATSPIGNLVLVAIVVVIAATAGLYIFPLANQASESAPAGNFEIETCHLCQNVALPGGGATTNYINVTYTDGEPIPAERLAVYLDGTKIFDPAKSGRAAYAQPAEYDAQGANDLRWSSDTVTAGERLVLADNADAATDAGNPARVFSEGQTIRVVWRGEKTDRNFTLAEATIRYD